MLRLMSMPFVAGVILAVGLGAVSLGHQVEAADAAGAKEKLLGGLEVGNDAIGHATLDRQKAVEFSLTQLAKLIDYLFVAAVAMLGLVVKCCVFDRLADAQNQPDPLPSWDRRLLQAAILFLAVSAILGILAYGYLPRLMTAASFSLNDSLGYFVLGQEFTCGLGLASLGIFCIRRLH